MNKREIIIEVRAAIAAHTQWKNYVQIKARGLFLKDLPVTAVASTDCNFGKWYFGEGAKLTSLTNYRNLENPHDKIHQIFIELNVLFNQNYVDSGLFSNAKKMNRLKQEKIQNLMEDFNSFSTILIEGLRLLEADVLKMSDAEVEVLI